MRKAGNKVKTSWCAFCKVVVPTKPFTNTTLYYNMLPLSGPTKVLQNALGVLMVDQKQCESLQNAFA
jgi:hypothetical protein